ncbi:hypothetical protein NPIL_354041 [Nephila pilipes]|uniref:Uncharacterized protein n=1 Tax=Nephila pilipes TaxID=299642 RepID=A0A8X6P0U6_NEPPI|nr:hypothetical protein NPIL_354041 [Nephila pilipes]
MFREAHDERSGCKHDAGRDDHNLAAKPVGRLTCTQAKHPCSDDGHADHNPLHGVIQLEVVSKEQHRTGHDPRVIAEEQASYSGQSGNQIHEQRRFFRPVVVQHRTFLRRLHCCGLRLSKQRNQQVTRHPP